MKNTKHCTLVLVITLFCITISSPCWAVYKLKDTLHTAQPIMVEDIETPEGKTILKAGTSVTLRILQDINSQKVDEGNVISMEVVVDVKDGQKVLVGTGVYAEGKVIAVKKANVFGAGAYLDVQAMNIQAVDGQRIRLKSQSLIRTGVNKKFLAWGGSIVLPVVGVLAGVPALGALAVFGLIIKGKAAKIERGELIIAEIAEDVFISG